MSNEKDQESDEKSKKLLNKINTDIEEIKAELKDLDKINRRVTTLEQIQMKILSGEIRVGQMWDGRQKPKNSNPIASDYVDKLEFEVFETETVPEENIFEFPGEKPQTETLPQEHGSDSEVTFQGDFDDLEYGCPFCGTTVGTFATVCQNCGRELEEEEDIAERENTNSGGSHKALDDYYRAQSSGKYGEQSETKSDDVVVEKYPDPPQERREKVAIEVEPMPERDVQLKEQLSKYAKGGFSEPEPLCSHCGQPLSYIEQYGRWYCHDCKKYSKSKVQPSPPPSESEYNEPEAPRSRARTGKKFPLKDYPRYSKK